MDSQWDDILETLKSSLEGCNPNRALPRSWVLEDLDFLPLPLLWVVVVLPAVATLLLVVDVDFLGNDRLAVSLVRELTSSMGG